MTNKEAEKLMEVHAAQLSEHFGAVQIMGTFLTSNGNTVCVKRGAGDYYARQGMAQEFIEVDRARTACEVKKEEYPDS